MSTVHRVALVFGDDYAKRVKRFGVTPYTYDSIQLKSFSTEAELAAYFRGVELAVGRPDGIDLLHKPGDERFLSIGHRVRDGRIGTPADFTWESFTTFDEGSSFITGIQDAEGWSGYLRLDSVHEQAFIQSRDKRTPVTRFELLVANAEAPVHLATYRPAEAMDKLIGMIAPLYPLNLKELHQDVDDTVLNYIHLAHEDMTLGRTLEKYLNTQGKHTGIAEMPAIGTATSDVPAGASAI